MDDGFVSVVRVVAGVVTGVWLFHRRSRYGNPAAGSVFANDDTEPSPASAR
ncbi:MAG: hypothetical protein QOJ29_4062 [Thermoleophilaceae bacterium]|nr:hypothetical protein [Thermoleophilaceae bacterium]